MNEKSTQYNYSNIDPQMHEFSGRREKALKVVAILKNFLSRTSKKPLKQMTWLELGCSLGGMTTVFVKECKKITGIDIDADAIKKARKRVHFKNAHFRIGDVLNLPFHNNSFDVVICNHVYEHVTEPFQMMSEIYRVLKKDGVCYFAGPNKYTIIEPHYNLPFLSWLPRSVSHVYMRITRRGGVYYEHPLSYPELERLTQQFKKIDYTVEVVKNPMIFQTTYNLQKIAAFSPSFFLAFLLPFMPSFFWILVKA